MKTATASVLIAAVVGTVTLAALAMILTSNPNANVEVNIKEGVIKYVKTAYGDIPQIQTKFAPPPETQKIVDDTVVVDNKIVSTKYGFEISAPDTTNWSLTTDESVIKQMFPSQPDGINFVSIISAKNPVENEYTGGVVVAVMKDAAYTVEEMVNSIDFRKGFEEGFTNAGGQIITQPDYYLTPTKDLAVVSFTANLNTAGNNQGYLFVVTLQKADTNNLYMSYCVVVDKYKSEPPSQLPTEFLDILSSFKVF